MKRLSVLLSALLALIVLLSACGAPAPVASEAPAATEAPASGPLVLKIANGSSITTWSPVASFSTESAYLSNSYEQLLLINPPGGAAKYKPLLAESWESNDDGTVWTFHLRRGVKFHDGEAMDAAAVKKSIETNAKDAVASFIWLPLDTVEVVDDYTVQINLKWSAPVDLIASSMYGAFIISPKALDAAAGDENFWNDGKSYGTGPYMVESYTPDSEIAYTRFDDYWGGWEGKHYDKVLVKLVPEFTTQQQMMEGGEVDLAARIPNENYINFQDNPDYVYLSEPSYFNYVGFFNTLRPPLDDIKVRQALSYAIPYEDIINIGANGRGTQSRGPVPAGVWPWSADVKQYSYDLEKAKELLKEAGHEDGGFSLNLTYASSNPTEEAFAPLIKDSYAQIGVDVTIQPMEWAQQWEMAKSDPANAQDMFLLLYWPTYSDAGSDNLWTMFYGSGESPYLNVTGFNLSYWKNDQFNALLDDAIAVTVTDPSKSQQEYIDAMNLLVDEAPGLFFMDTKTPFVYPKRIGGLQYNLNYPFVYFWFYELYPEP